MTGPFLFLFGISGGEILILLLLILLLFGPGKIPEIARMIGRGMNEVKKVQREINTEIHRYSNEIEKDVNSLQGDDRPKHQPAYQKEADETTEEAAPEEDPLPDDHELDDLPYPYKKEKDDEVN